MEHSLLKKPLLQSSHFEGLHRDLSATLSPLLIFCEFCISTATTSNWKLIEWQRESGVKGWHSFGLHFGAHLMPWVVYCNCSVITFPAVKEVANSKCIISLIVRISALLLWLFCMYADGVKTTYAIHLEYLGYGNWNTKRCYKWEDIVARYWGYQKWVVDDNGALVLSYLCTNSSLQFKPLCRQCHNKAIEVHTCSKLIASALGNFSRVQHTFRP